MGTCQPDAEHDHKHGEEGHDHDHGSGDKDSHQKIIRLSDEAVKEEGIEVSPVGPGTLQISVSLPGEVAINADRMAHIVPRLGGIVREVRKKAGDTVRAGEVMAVMESRELAEAKAKYLAALKRLELAKSNYTRFETLWKKEAIPEKQYLEFKNALDEAEIERDSAEQKLRALGFLQEFLQKLSKEPADSLARYEIEAPFDGTVIHRHMSLGEMLKEDADSFVVADLNSVWVNIHVYPKDLSHVREGQQVIISTGNGIPDTQGTIEYVEPVVGDKTRAAVARVVLPNPEKKWRPGLFVTAKVVVESVDVPVLVPKTALKTIEGKPVAFVREDEGFEPRTVKTGKSDASHVEIVAGLQAGEWFASDGSFLLKAEAGKGEAGHEH
ncbi:MAG: efflux RND transporter periplasmic adaptor subunit [Desulfomonile tiedjei]|uniref:Efflux RND transporter periplasmic adaptor subunit n=1 Tax=Desulfomonile tiedjei TaxID=2358 RepID=A0A9D6V6M1_9BACT|nr:efflux RND transporter periplasmic adaptor subunit [Desulfomonile tiedjei]